MENNKYKILSTVNSPEDLKKYKSNELFKVCEELREFIIDIISENPGHLGASLGVVELTVALHYVFNTPNDKIVWDVGHQAYGHKILTGRRDQFHTNRKYKGISGFPKLTESEYDAFGVGHSSTSISAALGIALASNFNKQDDKNVIAVIGDGAMTGGMAIEGLNNAGIQNSNLLVILNDNHMAIEPNVGALNEYLLDITTSKTYNRVKEEIWHLLGKLSRFGPNTQSFIQKIENGIKSVILRQSNLFEALNFRYFGPVDGHDVVHLSKVLQDLKNIPGPKLLHCLTKKGKGFKFAEQDQPAWHAPGLFDKKTGEKITIQTDKPKMAKYQDVFGATLLELARGNDKIVGITPAMPSGSGINILMKEMPDRAFDVGIAEQHAVTFAAGMATDGIIPFCSIYSSFMQRAYDQVIHDVALQKLPVILCIDRAGLVGEDGPTHHGVYDLAYLRGIPNIIISAPMNESELRNLMYTAQKKDHGPFAIRYPKGNVTSTNWKKPFEEIEIGKAKVIQKGKDIAILTIGTIGNKVIEITKSLQAMDVSVTHINMRFLKPLDENLLHQVFKNHDHILTIEDGTRLGGLGSAVMEFKCENDYAAKVKALGMPDRFIEHGSVDELMKEIGLDKDGIMQSILKSLKKQIIDKEDHSETAQTSKTEFRLHPI